MLDFCIYLLYRAGSAIIGVLPVRLVFSLGEILGFLLWLVLPKYRQLAFRNLTIAFGATKYPGKAGVAAAVSGGRSRTSAAEIAATTTKEEKTPREMCRLVRLHFQSLGANLLCGVKLSTMPMADVVRHIKVENLEAVHRQLRNGTPVVFVLSHLSNWELLAQLFPNYIGYVRNSTVYQKLGNRYIDKHLRRIRGRTGVELFDRSEGFHRAIELLRSGGAIGILGDQHAGDHGLWTPFFGRLASTSPLPALLARRTGAALMAATIHTEGKARWRFVFTDRLDAPDDSVQMLTAKANEIIAGQIRSSPEDWFWVHNRWKTPKPHFLLPRYKRGIFVPPNESLEPFRIVIRSPNWLGDSVMAVPAVRAIKAGRPDAHVTIAAPEKLAPIWKLIPEVDEVLLIPKRSVFGIARVLKRQAAFDVAILFPNSLRSALEVWLADVPRRVGFGGHHRRWLLNQIIPERENPGPIEHQSVRYLRIAEAVGAGAGKTFNVQRPTSNVQLPTVRQPSTTNDRVLIGLCPGAEYGPTKRWLPERFAETAATLSEQVRAQWILFGTKKDEEIGRTIAAALGEKCVNRIGQTTLEELIAELRECRLLLTNDTGTMHLATLLGVPVVAIFGSTEPRLTGPLGEGHVVLRHQVECSPCFLRECPIDFRCMKAVTTDEVIRAVESLL
jgi:lipopolysaccharide heptosyltransferase II